MSFNSYTIDYIICLPSDSNVSPNQMITDEYRNLLSDESAYLQANVTFNDGSGFSADCFRVYEGGEPFFRVLDDRIEADVIFELGKEGIEEWVSLLPAFDDESRDTYLSAVSEIEHRFLKDFERDVDVAFLGRSN